ncbi:unnamed protein product, partial [Rhizoctonia solani]
IPVSKSCKDKYCVEHDHISVQKGDTIAVPIIGSKKYGAKMLQSFGLNDGST